MTEELTHHQKLIIDALNSFHTFCEDNGFTYYLTGGTLLGAIRHQGIIPWDDDVDICMPREDYNRLISEAGSIFQAPYKLNSYELDAEYFYPFAKFYDTSLEVTEHFEGVSYTSGAWVDIFPLDGTFKNKKLRKLHFFLVRKLRFLFELKVRGYQLPNSKYKANFGYYFKVFLKPIVFAALKLVPTRYLYRIMDGVASCRDQRKSNTVGRLYSRYRERATFSDTVFQSRFLTDFNEYQFYVPEGYDEYLRALYGDYMTPPSKENRATHNIEVKTHNES